MNSTSTYNLIKNSFTTYGHYATLILASFLTIGIGYLVFKQGWKRLGSFDMSGNIGGFYYAKTPYRGYNRWRSKSWNMKNTMPQ